MPELVSYTDVAIGNEEDADKVFGIHAPETDAVDAVAVFRNALTAARPEDEQAHPDPAPHRYDACSAPSPISASERA